MLHDIKIPDLGESITEGILADWLRNDGDLVEEGEVVAELETDKVSMQIMAPRSGRLAVKVEEGETVLIGQVVATVDDAEAAEAAAQSQRKPPVMGAATSPAVTASPPTAAASPAVTASPPTAAARPMPMDVPTTPAPAARRTDAAPGGPPIAPAAGRAQAAAKLAGATGPDVPLSPAVRRIVAEQGLDPDDIKPSGHRGRLTKGDVLRHVGGHVNVQPNGALAAQTVMTTTPSPAASPPPQPAKAEAVRPPAGRAPGAATVPRPKASVSVEQTPAPAGVRQTRQRMSPLRQRIAERLLMAKQQTAMLTTFNEVDMSAVMAHRARHKVAFEQRHGVRLGFTSFFVKATVDALRTVPHLNAYLDGDELVMNHFYDIGVAVSTERGLMVPVLRGCDQLSFADVERGVADFATRARDRTITLDELQGGCFTISNGGVFGSLLSTPILNPPQSGILGLHAIKKRPVVVDDQVVARPMMYLALSYDHRVVDGREAVTFLKRLAECIENPERMMLEV